MFVVMVLLSVVLGRFETEPDWKKVPLGIVVVEKVVFGVWNGGGWIWLL